MFKSPFSDSAAPSSANSSGSSGSDTNSPEDIVSILGSDDKEDKKEDKKEDNKEDKVDKTDKEDKEEDDAEIELKEEDEEGIEFKEEDEEVEVAVPPRKKELLKDYPDLFKKHPALEGIIYRDRQYQEMFGSFDDAKEIKERAESFDKFESDLLEGNAESIFKEVRENDRDSFNRLVDDLLPNLYKVDKDAYVHVAGNIVKDVIRKMALEAKNLEANDEETSNTLRQAALTINQFIFGTSQYEPPTRLSGEKAKDDTLDKEREQFNQERLDTSIREVTTKVSNVIRNTISEYIDPKGEMSAFEKKNAIREAIEEIDSFIGKDKDFRKQLDRLWDAHKKDKYSKATLDRIKSVLLGKSKNLMKTAIKKARAEVLKDKTPRRNANSDQESDRKPPIRSGRPHLSNSGKPEMKKGESVEEFLMRD